MNVLGTRIEGNKKVDPELKSRLIKITATNSAFFPPPKKNCASLIGV